MSIFNAVAIFKIDAKVIFLYSLPDSNCLIYEVLKSAFSASFSCVKLFFSLYTFILELKIVYF